MAVPRKWKISLEFFYQKENNVVKECDLLSDDWSAAQELHVDRRSERQRQEQRHRLDAVRVRLPSAEDSLEKQRSSDSQFGPVPKRPVGHCQSQL